MAHDSTHDHAQGPDLQKLRLAAAPERAPTWDLAEPNAPLGQAAPAADPGAPRQVPTASAPAHGGAQPPLGMGRPAAAPVAPAAAAPARPVDVRALSDDVLQAGPQPSWLLDLQGDVQVEGGGVVPAVEHSAAELSPSTSYVEPETAGTLVTRALAPAGIALLLSFGAVGAFAFYKSSQTLPAPVGANPLAADPSVLLAGRETDLVVPPGNLVDPGPASSREGTLRAGVLPGGTSAGSGSALSARPSAAAPVPSATTTGAQRGATVPTPSVVAAEPVVAEPVAAEPVAAEPVAAEPVAAEPVAAEPVAAEPVRLAPVDAHALSELTRDEPEVGASEPRAQRQQEPESEPDFDVAWEPPVAATPARSEAPSLPSQPEAQAAPASERSAELWVEPSDEQAVEPVAQQLSGGAALDPSFDALLAGLLEPAALTPAVPAVGATAPELGRAPEAVAAAEVSQAPDVAEARVAPTLSPALEGPARNGADGAALAERLDSALANALLDDLFAGARVAPPAATVAPALTATDSEPEQDSVAQAAPSEAPAETVVDPFDAALAPAPVAVAEDPALAELAQLLGVDVSEAYGESGEPAATAAVALPNADLPNADLPNADLPNADLADADLADADLADADLPGADLPGADLPETTPNGRDLDWVAWEPSYGAAPADPEVVGPVTGLAQDDDAPRERAAIELDFDGAVAREPFAEPSPVAESSERLAEERASIAAPKGAPMGSAASDSTPSSTIERRLTADGSIPAETVGPEPEVTSFDVATDRVELRPRPFPTVGTAADPAGGGVQAGVERGPGFDGSLDDVAAALDDLFADLGRAPRPTGGSSEPAVANGPEAPAGAPGGAMVGGAHAIGLDSSANEGHVPAADLAPVEVVGPVAVQEQSTAPRSVLRRVDESDSWTAADVPNAVVNGERFVTTPNTGNVRVIFGAGDVFEGRLHGVGEGRIALDTKLGRMTLDSRNLDRIERLAPNGSGPRSPANVVNDTTGLEEVRVKAKGGVFHGYLVSREGNRVTLILREGYRITVEAEDVTAVGNSRATSTLRRVEPR
ncbi:MAG: pentapeptide repeat-containing protein [Planctomycetota bacterium]